MSPRRPISPTRAAGRRAPTRAPRQRYLVCCEGEVTEREYIQYLRRRLRGTLVEVEIVGDLGDPKSVIDAASARRDTARRDARRRGDPFLAYDAVWCVVDVDNHATLEAALSRAGQVGIEVSVSNPCFEIWPILHFRDHTAYSSPRDLSAVLEIYFPGYEKSLRCDLLAGRYPSAKTRARGLAEMHASAGDSPASNPSTDVWRLVEALCTSAASGSSTADLSLL